MAFLYYRKVFQTSYNIKTFHKKCKAIFEDEQRQDMKSNLKEQKILIMLLLFDALDMAINCLIMLEKANII